jgi:hypothetical protein
VLQDFKVPSAVLTGVLLATVVGTLILSGLILLVMLSREEQRRRAEQRAARARRLRFLRDDKEVVLAQLPSLERQLRRVYPPSKPLPPSAPGAGPFHLFLSHNWAHGQSAMRIVKNRLREMLPDVEIFLGTSRAH